MSDLNSAFRHLTKSPGFALLVVLTLALGIGANTAIFSVINSALLQPLPYSEPDRLVEMWSIDTEGGHYPAVTGPQYQHWRDHATSFESIAIYHDRYSANLIADGQAERVDGAEVSAGYLDVLRVAPMLGRGFEPGQDKLGGDNRAIVLTHEWWQSRFGADPTIVGKTLNLGQQHYRVLGVLPPRALPNDSVQFLVPLVLEDGAWRLDPTTGWAGVIARLKPGVTLAQADAEAVSLASELMARTLPTMRFLGVQVLPFETQLVERTRTTLLLLLGAVALVLLIVCANIANLLLARASIREKEMALRSALGASPTRIVRQVLTESLVLSAIGGIVGVALAPAAMALLSRAIAGGLPRMVEPEIDGTVLAFSLIVSCGTGLLVGLFPALQAMRTNVNSTLKLAGRGTTSGSRRAQSSLIVSEVALTVMLLIGAGLLMRSFARVLTAETGFRPRQTLACDISLTGSSFSTPDELRARDDGPAQLRVLEFQRELRHRVARLPGIQAVGTSTTIPLSNREWGIRVGLPGRPAEEFNLGSVIDHVGGDYFQSMGISLLRGRVFTEDENVHHPRRLAVINEQLATALFASEDPIGRQIRFADADWEVIGVVGNVRQLRLDLPARPHVYTVQAVNPWTLSLSVRTAASPAAMIRSIRAAVAELDSSHSLSNFRTLEEAMNNSVRERRVTLVLLGVFAAIALGLACLGVYGVIAFMVGQRTRELCIRVALGAQRRDVVRLVLREGMRLGVAGIVVGLLGSAVATRLIASQLYEVNAYDPLVFATAGAIVAAVALAALCLPAWRAARADPITALRAE